MKKVTGILTTMLLLCLSAYSQDEILTDSQTEQKSKEIEIYFDHDSYVINLDSPQNRNTLDKLPSIIEALQADSLTAISKIVISSYTSPEGGCDYNKKLSANRTNSIYDYLRDAISVPYSIIEKCNLGIDWAGLCRAVEASDMEYKADVLNIIKTVPEETWRRVNPTDRWQTLVDSRNKHLMDLEYGNPYRWMLANIFPQLHRSSVVTIYFQAIIPPIIEEEITLPTKEIVEPIIEEVSDIKDVAEEPAPVVAEAEDKLRFAIKTNLAQLGIAVANIGIEIPLSDKLSLDIPFSYSPYDLRSDLKFRIMALQPEFRYWLNLPFKGHFFGVHLHGFYYNIAINGEYRYQNHNNNTPAYGGGLSYGYAMDIIDRLGIEFTIGAGYINTKYDKFYNIENGAFVSTHTKNYWGITRLGITLSYRFNK